MKNFAIVSETMTSISDRSESYLDFITVTNITNTCNGEFSYANAKDLMSYLKTLILMQQVFWERNKELSHGSSTLFTGVLLYELFTH